MRENAEAKGRRYLLEGRLQVEHVDEATIRARCRGGGEVYELGWGDVGNEVAPEGGWFCSCPALGRCAHLIAPARDGPPAASSAAAEAPRGSPIRCRP